MSFDELIRLAGKAAGTWRGSATATAVAAALAVIPMHTAIEEDAQSLDRLPGAGRVVSIDPDTKEVRAATPEERAALGVAADLGFKSDDFPPAERLGDGTLRLRLNGRLRAAAVGRIESDGELQVECTNGDEGADVVPRSQEREDQ